MIENKDRIDIGIFLPRRLATFLDSERNRLSINDPEGAHYSRADVILGLIELHRVRRELTGYKEYNYQIMMGELDELLPLGPKPRGRSRRTS